MKFSHLLIFSPGLLEYRLAGCNLVAPTRHIHSFQVFLSQRPSVRFTRRSLRGDHQVTILNFPKCQWVIDGTRIPTIPRSNATTLTLRLSTPPPMSSTTLPLLKMIPMDNQTGTQSLIRAALQARRHISIPTRCLRCLRMHPRFPS